MLVIYFYKSAFYNPLFVSYSIKLKICSIDVFWSFTHIYFETLVLVKSTFEYVMLFLKIATVVLFNLYIWIRMLNYNEAIRARKTFVKPSQPKRNSIRKHKKLVHCWSYRGPFKSRDVVLLPIAKPIFTIDISIITSWKFDFDNKNGHAHFTYLSLFKILI